MGANDQPRSIEFELPDLSATERLAEALVTQAQPGLVVLLDGPVGAGKTTLARAVIQHCLAQYGFFEDVPSPTFTIVQSYDAGALSIWHADLYRLSNTSELEELGLSAAFEDAFCLIEWPDRLGDAQPPALGITLSYGEAADARLATMTTSTPLIPDLNIFRQAVFT